MAQGVFPFQYEIEKKGGGVTGLAGLPAYVEFAQVMGLNRIISEDVRARQSDQGWTDEQMVMSLVLLNLVGGIASRIWWCWKETRASVRF